MMSPAYKHAWVSISVVLLASLMLVSWAVGTPSRAQVAQITPENTFTVIPATQTPSATPTVIPTTTITPTPWPSATPTPSLTPFPADGEVITYASDRSGNMAIYLRHLSSGAERLLHEDVGIPSNAPHLFPQRPWVAYETSWNDQYFIEIVHVSDMRIRNRPSVDIADFLTYNAWGPTVSPDGAWMVFHSDIHDGNIDLHILPVSWSEGAEPWMNFVWADEWVRLTDAPGADMHAGWSPDSAQLVYQCTIGEGREICIINRDGSGYTRLTNNAFFDGFPDWSPDGARIAFASTREGNADLYSMSIDGSDVQRLTFRPGSIDTNPVWSPDGTRLAFESDQGGDWEICILVLATGDIDCITDNDDITDWSPDW